MGKTKLLLCALAITSICSFNANTIAFAKETNVNVVQVAATGIPSGYERLTVIASSVSISVQWIESTKSIKFSGGAMPKSVTLSLAYLTQNYGAYSHTDGRTYMSRSNFSDLMFFEFGIQ